MSGSYLCFGIVIEVVLFFVVDGIMVFREVYVLIFGIREYVRLYGNGKLRL